MTLVVQPVGFVWIHSCAMDCSGHTFPFQTGSCCCKTSCFGCRLVTLQLPVLRLFSLYFSYKLITVADADLCFKGLGARSFAVGFFVVVPKWLLHNFSLFLQSLELFLVCLWGGIVKLTEVHCNSNVNSNNSKSFLHYLDFN